MARYVALLRGINVGGIRIKMDALRATFDAIGMQDVKTILASGNVVFSSKSKSATALKKKIEKALRDTFGYDAWIVLVDAAQLAAIVEKYPFDAEAKDVQPYVLFGSESGILAELSKLDGDLDSEEERIAVGKSVIYWEVQKGRSTDSKFGKTAAKPRYKSTTTGRNMRTLQKVLAVI